MATHSASVTLKAPLDQVYKFWSHFNDYPKFMTFVKEVTYKDDQNSHWVVDIVGKHAWDARNVGWSPNQTIGWESTDGIKNSGTVTFFRVSDDITRVQVELNYDPPAGILGEAAEKLVAGGKVQTALQTDLDNFAEMVEQAGPGALDPESSSYLYHKDSAAATGTSTQAQNQSMQSNPSSGSAAGVA